MFKGRFLSADEAATVADGDLGSLEPGLRERQRLWWWWHVWRRSRGRQELHSTSPGPCSTNFAFSSRICVTKRVNTNFYRNKNHFQDFL